MPEQLGIRKAAVFLNGLDKETAGMLLERFPAEESREIRREMITVENISPSEINKTVRQFLKETQSAECKSQSAKIVGRHSGQTTLSGDGDLFELSIGAQSAKRKVQIAKIEVPSAECESQDTEIKVQSTECEAQSTEIENHSALCALRSALPRRFDYLERRLPFEIAEFLAEESEQLIAVVLSQMTPRYSGDVLACFEQSLKRNLIRRLAKLDATDETILDEIDTALKDRLKREVEDRPKTKPGLALLERILQVVENELDNGIENNIGNDILSGLSEIEQEEWEVQSSEIRVQSEENQSLCTLNSELCSLHFDDLGLLEDHDLEALFRTLDRDLVVKSLVGCDAWFIERVLGLFPVYEQISLREMLYHAASSDVEELDYARQCVMSGIEMRDEGRNPLPYPLSPIPYPLSSTW